MHTLKPNLPPMPARIAALPVSERGFPIPFFVAYVDGKPEFRAADARKKVQCLGGKLCWVCGQKLGAYKCFAIGPMCVVNRNTAEPPCHFECAEWSTRACPFMVNPAMVRRENNMPEDVREPAGVAIRRNPGVIALYTTKAYRLVRDGDDYLIALGAATSIEWMAEGRKATRAEVIASIESGLPILRKMAEEEGDRSVAALEDMTRAAMRLLPPGTSNDAEGDQDQKQNQEAKPAAEGIPAVGVNAPIGEGADTNQDQE